MADIFSDPVKTVLFAVIVILEVPAFIFLVCAWFKAKREEKKNKE